MAQTERREWDRTYSAIDDVINAITPGAVAALEAVLDGLPRDDDNKLAVLVAESREGAFLLGFAYAYVLITAVARASDGRHPHTRTDPPAGGPPAADLLQLTGLSEATAGGIYIDADWLAGRAMLSHHAADHMHARCIVAQLANEHGQDGTLVAYIAGWPTASDLAAGSHRHRSPDQSGYPRSTARSPSRIAVTFRSTSASC